MPNHNYSSKYFTPQELVPRKVYDTLGTKSYCLFEKKILQQLDKLRGDYGKALKINDWNNGGSYSESGYRELYTYTGASKSSHKFGYAFDIKHYDHSSLQSLREFIIENAELYRIKRVENFDSTPTWIHLEFTTELVDVTYYFNP